MNRDHLDVAVDTVVREIMSAQPADDLAGRVQRRISAPSSSRPFRTLTLAVAACLLLLAAVGPRVLREWRSNRSAEVASSRSGTAEPAGRALASPAAAPRADARGAAVAQSESPAVTAGAWPPAPRTAFVSWPAEIVTVGQLDPIRPIDVAPIAQAQLRIDEIAIAPLEIEPLQIDPLSSATQQ